MLDPKLQARFTRSCTDAAFGYTVATIAAYAAFTEKVLNFWADALQPVQSGQTRETCAWTASPVSEEDALSVPFGPFAWMMDPRWQPPMTSSSYGDAAASPFAAWCGMFPIAASPAVWPMAFMLMSAGVPRSVAWPTAEANAAVMEAADVAAVSVKQVFANYQTPGGHAVSSFWPPATLMTMAAFAPFNVNAIINAFRFA